MSASGKHRTKPPKVADRTVDVLIVGGGQGGVQVATELRRLGFEGSIVVIDNQSVAPYARPPLSKEFLAGIVTAESIAFREPEFWREERIDVVLQEEVIAVHPAAHAVRTRSGLTVGFGTMVWAAGGRPRKTAVPGAGLAGIYYVGTIADARELQRVTAAGRRVVVVGGGYVGLEVAATLTKSGLAVAVAELEPRLLSRVTGPVVSDFYSGLHRSAGVDVRVEARVVSFFGESGHVTGVELDTGEVLPADAVVVGIGMVPNVEPLVGAGGATERGVLIDAYCRTTLPDVLAVGDCTLFAGPFTSGRQVRLESVQNATDQGKVASRTILGELSPYDTVPWFWSNQFDAKLKSVGLQHGADETIVRGTPAEGAFSVVYLREGRLIAVDAINRVSDYVQGRWLIERSARLTNSAKVTDSSIPLKAAFAAPG